MGRKFAYDVEYVNRITFLGDIKIIILTVKTALKRESIGTRGVDAQKTSMCIEDSRRNMEDRNGEYLRR